MREPCKMDNCDEPRRKHYATCEYHSSSRFAGQGKLVCNICGRPQTEHTVGYYEHAALAAAMKTRRTEIHARK